MRYNSLHLSTRMHYNNLRLTTPEWTAALQESTRISRPCDTTESKAYYTWVHGWATTECAVYYDWIHGCATTGSTSVLQLRLQLFYGWVYGCVTNEFTAELQQIPRLLKLNISLRYNWFYGSLASPLHCLQCYPSRWLEKAGCKVLSSVLLSQTRCVDCAAVFTECTALYRADCLSALRSRNLSEGFREFRHCEHANGGLVN
jgi:hypothetical protein